jgi:hypothetical protein
MTRISGIVMENNQGRMVILSPEGEYIKTRTNIPLEVGEYYEGPVIVPWKSALAVMLVLAFTLGAFDFFSVQAYAQVSQAVELGVNRWGRVVTTRALNDEGTQILQTTDLKGKKIETAVEEITMQSSSDSKMGQDHELKVFPGKAADQGNKEPDEFLQRVEDNMNQGYYRALEKNNPSINSDDPAKNNNNNNSDKAKQNSNQSSNSDKAAKNVNNKDADSE